MFGQGVHAALRIGWRTGRDLKFYEVVLQQDDPDPAVRLDVALAYQQAAIIQTYLGQFEPAPDRYTQAIEVAEAILRNEPHYVTAWLDLHGAHGGRAQAYSDLKRYDEAVADWDRVLELSDEAIRPGYRLSRAVVLMLAGNHGQAAEEAEALLQESPGSGDTLYNSACLYARKIRIL